MASQNNNLLEDSIIQLDQYLSYNDHLSTLMTFDQDYIYPSFINSTKSLYEDFEQQLNTYIYTVSQNDDWGGENEKALDAATINNINIFKDKALKPYLEYLPYVYATNDGQLSFEWECEKYLSIIRINRFGLNFLKTLKDEIVCENNCDEASRILSFSGKPMADIERCFYIIFLQINDRNSL